MGKKIGQTVIGITADIAQLRKDLSSGVSEFSKFTKQIKGVASTLGGAFAVREITQMAMNLAKAADIQEKALAKVNQAIRTTGGAAGYTTKELAAMASKLQGESLFGDEVILNDVTAQLLTFTNIAGKEFSRAQKAALDLSTVLGSDLKGQTIQLGKALNDPVKGLTALRKSGISFSEAQIDVIKNLAETNQLAKAQTLILDELERQYGGQAKVAAETALGPWQQMLNQLGDLGEQMGSGFIPILNNVAETVSSLLPIFDNSTTRLEKLKLKFQESNAGITDLLPKYEQLKEKTKRTNEEQAELERITSQLAKLFPGAATALDGYLDIDVTKLKDLIEAQRELLTLQSKIELKNLNKKLELLERQKKLQTDIVNQGNIQLPSTFGTFSQFEPAKRTDATDKDIEKLEELELQAKETTYAIEALENQLNSGFINTSTSSGSGSAGGTGVVVVPKVDKEKWYETLQKEADEIDKAVEVKVAPLLNYDGYKGQMPELKDTSMDGVIADEANRTAQIEWFRDLQSEYSYLYGIMQNAPDLFPNLPERMLTIQSTMQQLIDSGIIPLTEAMSWQADEQSRLNAEQEKATALLMEKLNAFAAMGNIITNLNNAFSMAGQNGAAKLAALAGAIAQIIPQIQSLTQAQQTNAVAAGVASAAATPFPANIAAIATIIATIASVFGSLKGSKKGKTPGFASGGIMGAGWSVVGEYGKELMYNSGAQKTVLPAGTSSKILSNINTPQEVAVTVNGRVSGEDLVFALDEYNRRKYNSF